MTQPWPQPRATCNQPQRDFTPTPPRHRRTALAMASKPDGAPLTSIEPMVGVGMLQPPPGAEATLYMQVWVCMVYCVWRIGMCLYGVWVCMAYSVWCMCMVYGAALASVLTLNPLPLNPNPNPNPMTLRWSGRSKSPVRTSPCPSRALTSMVKVPPPRRKTLS